VDRRFLVVAGLMQVATLSTYWSYLHSTTTLGLGTAAVLALAAAVTASAVLVLRLSGRTARWGHAARPTRGHLVGAGRDPQPAGEA
jgi:hypothetical protein